jgi:hypothetical protein
VCFGVYTVARASMLFNCYLTSKIHILLVCYEENIIKREIDHELGEYQKTVIYGHWSKNRSQTKVVELDESYKTCQRSFCKNWLR